MSFGAGGSVVSRGLARSYTSLQQLWWCFHLCFSLYQNQREFNKHVCWKRSCSLNAGCLPRRGLLTETWCFVVFLCSFWNCDVCVCLLCEWSECCEALKWRNGVNDGADGTPGRRLAAISNPNYSLCSENRHNGINTWQFRILPSFGAAKSTHQCILISLCRHVCRRVCVAATLDFLSMKLHRSVFVFLHNGKEPPPPVSFHHLITSHAITARFL